MAGNTVSVKAVLKDYLGRRKGLLKALTTERKGLYLECDPDNKNKLCLIGLPNGEWEVGLPDDLPRDFPTPHIGINTCRKKDEHYDDDKSWFETVAEHSDEWLDRLRTYLAGKSNFDEEKRQQFLERTVLEPLSVLLDWEATAKEALADSDYEESESCDSDEAADLQLYEAAFCQSSDEAADSQSEEDSVSQQTTEFSARSSAK